MDDTQNPSRTWSTRVLLSAAAGAVVLGVGAGAALGAVSDGSTTSGPGASRLGQAPGGQPPGGQVPGGQAPTDPSASASTDDDSSST